MVTITTVNVNGIRAATRKGMGAWLSQVQPDILCLQEVRASMEDLRAAIPSVYHLHHDPCLIKGRAGVAIASRLPFAGLRTGLGLAGDVNTGRWVEADIKIPGWPTPLTLASAYVHVGELETPKQALKHEFLTAMTKRIGDLDDVRFALICGDINVAHTERDIRAWKGNVGKRGFTAEERAHLTTWFSEQGWVDVGRHLAGDVDGPYTWWSWRGRAFDNDTGWRIDYHIASPLLANRAAEARVDRALTWDSRWSDHSPLTVHYTNGTPGR